MGKRAVKTITTCLLIVALLSCSFSVYAVEYDPDYTEAQEDITNQWLYYVYLTLRAWGIEIQFNDYVGYTDEVGVYLWQLTQQWLETIPSIDSWSALIFPWKWSVDNWGRFKGNENFLQDVQDFSEWLVTELALATDSEYVVQQGMDYVFDDDGNKYYVGYYGSDLVRLATPVYTIDTTYDHESGYTYWNEGRYRTYYRVYNNGYGRFVGVYVQELRSGQYVAAGSTSVPLSNPVDTWYCRFFYYEGGTVGGSYREPGVYFYYSNSLYNGNPSVYTPQYYFHMNLSSAGSDGSLVIVTGDIDIPDNLNPDDSIVIDGDEVTYIQIDWPESIDIGNLPAVISTGELENPEIDQIYTNIPALIEEAGDSMEIMRQIIFRMPDGVLIALYGLLSAGVIFGFLRIMREH